MVKRSFVGLMKPRLEYEHLSGTPAEMKEIPIPRQATLFLKKPADPKLKNDTVALAKGDAVKTGQKISLTGDSTSYVVSSVTGKVSSVSSYIGDFGKNYLSICIETAGKDEFDDRFSAIAKNPALETARDYLTALPGNPPFPVFFNPEKPIHTICITGTDHDLLVATNQHVLMTRIDDIKKGISILKKITRIERILLTVPGSGAPLSNDIGAEIRPIKTGYPAALPQIMMRDFLGQLVPPGKTCEDLGVSFFTAEAVASIGRAFASNAIPVSKIITVIGKDGKKSMVSARIGTPVQDILAALGIAMQDKDRLIVGGPMTGSAVFSESYPVLGDTSAILVQDHADIIPVSDYPCINCGECVRICPAKIPVNMLVRYLEAGRYEEAADLYDLYYCIECGLCSYVCVSRMPIFQYIRLGKYELHRRQAAEASHD